MNDPYTTAIAAYALTRLKSPLAAAAAHHLSNMAIRQGQQQRPIVANLL